MHPPPSQQGFGVFSFVYEQLTEALTTAGYRVLTFDFYGARLPPTGQPYALSGPELPVWSD